MEKTSLFVPLATIILQATLAGCNNNNSSSTIAPSQANQPTEISVAYWNIEEALLLGKKDAVLQRMQKDLNIVLKPVNITNSNWTIELQ